MSINPTEPDNGNAKPGNAKPGNSKPGSPKSTFGSKAVVLIGATVLGAWALSFVIIPIAQERGEFDPLASICRALGLRNPVSTTTGKPYRGGSAVTWTAATIDDVGKGDIARGEKLAAETCVACHLPNGLSADPSLMPSITGQPARAIYKQLWDIKTGVRTNDAMKSLVDELTGQDVSDLAAYYSALPSRNFDIRNDSEVSAATLALVQQGDASRALPSCQACHDPRSGGPLEAPGLTGQYPAYVEAQLRAYAGGARHNDIFARMRAIAGKLTSEEISDVARYYDAPR